MIARAGKKEGWKEILSVRDLSFRYPGASRLVLTDFRCGIAAGDFVAILGPNGSGKTTLLQTICTNLRPERGEIMIEGQSVRELSPKQLARRLAVVHQSLEYSFDFTVYDTVLMGRYPYLGRFQGETEHDLRIVEEAMQATAVGHLRDNRLHGISGGERQRVMIARALAQEPEILLLDEPISHLDLKYQIEVMELCKRLNREGMTILMTLHDINMASRFADRIMILNEGRLLHSGSPEDTVTPERIASIYGVEVEIVDRGYPHMIPK
ncbi:MAG: ABC transporter ATP-binding protein [Bacillota bacterium]|nr:ABC transporter ATP-binding protein [Bacillota bacterium]